MKQQDLIKMEDEALPTVSLESILITSTIDAHEGRDVAVDTPDAYLHTGTDEEIIMLLEG